MSAQVDPERELWIYEGMRLGSVRALRTLLQDLHDDLLLVAELYEPSSPERLVADSVATAVRGLGMFTWHTSMRAWLFGILISAGREKAHRSGAAPGPDPQRILATAAAGTDQQRIGSVRDVPWTGWWDSSSWARLSAWLRSRPLREQEVLVLADVLDWPPGDVRDALAVSAGVVEALRNRATQVLLTRLSEDSGQSVTGDVGELLAQQPRHPHDVGLQPIISDYRSWRSARGVRVTTRLRGLVRRGPSSGVSATLARLGPAI